MDMLEICVMFLFKFVQVCETAGFREVRVLKKTVTE